MRTPLVTLVLLVLSPVSAWASGSLVISLQDDHGRAVEGTATATPVQGGQAHSCSTHGGRCTINGLAAGQFRVSATVLRGGFVPAGTVVVQDGRAASVRLNALPPPVAGGVVQQQGGGGSNPPPVVNGGAQGGTHAPGAGPAAGVTVQVGQHVTAGAGQPRTLRPYVPGQGPQPIVVVPGGGQAQPQAAGGVVMVNGAQANGGGRNLGSGQHAAVVGTTQDQRGRRVEGTVTVTQQGRSIGSVSTTGGSFTCFDLTAGTYTLSFRALSGERASRDVAVGAGAASSVRLSVVR